MSYTVKWRRRAIDMLAQAYLEAQASGLADEMTAASARIEAGLRRDPSSLGESRSADRRVCFDLPLTIEFRVNESRRWVIVVAAR